MLVRLFAASLVLGLLAAPTPAFDYIWNNPAGGNWNIAANWGGTLPCAADTATLGTLSNAYSVTVTDTRSITNLTVTAANATLLHTNGSLIVGGTFAVDAGSYNLNGGSLNINGTMTTGATAVANWTAGRLIGSGTLAGTIEVNGNTSGGLRIGGSVLKNSGTLILTAGTIYNENVITSVLTNLSGGMIDIRSDGTAFAVTGGASRLVNQGVIRKSAGSGTTGIEWALDNAGIVAIDTGVLAFRNGGTLGNSTVAANATAYATMAGGNFTLTSGATLTATPRTDGGASLVWTGGIFGTSSGTASIAGRVDVDGDTSGGLRLAGIGTRNAGTLEYRGGTIFNERQSNAQLTNLLGGTINVQADGTAFAVDISGSTEITNQGLLRKSGGSGTTIIGWRTTNTGTVRADVGVLAFNGSFTNTGVVTMAAGSRVNANITTGSGGSVRGPAAATGTFGGNLNFLSGGTLAPGGSATGRLEIVGTLFLNSGARFEVGVNGMTPITEYDTVSVTGTVAVGNAILAGNTLGLTATTGDRFAILENDGTDAITGTFAGLPQGGAGQLGGYFFLISYVGDANSLSLTGGNDILLYSLTPVPEPAFITVVATIGLALGGVARRQRPLAPRLPQQLPDAALGHVDGGDGFAEFGRRFGSGLSFEGG